MSLLRNHSTSERSKIQPMVAPDSGYSKPISPGKAKAAYAGVNLPVFGRGKGPSQPVDESLESNPERQLILADRMAMVRRCSMRYPKECEFIDSVYLFLLDSVPMEEIAKRMGVSRTTAYSRIHRTLGFLEKYIREQEHEA